MKTHQTEIESTRVGGFGSSDAKMFYKIGLKGLSSLSNSDKKRIAVAKGLEEYKPITQTESMLKGHQFEDWFEDNIKHCNFEREPKLSKKLAKNFDTFFHADIFYEKTNDVLELKYLSNPKSAAATYMEQLQWQMMISDCDVSLIVGDSNLDDFNISETLAIDKDERTINTLLKGINLLDEAWDSLDLTVGEDWQEDDLMYFEKPEVVALAGFLSEIKVLEKRAEEQKEKVLNLMLSNSIKSLKSDLYSITLVPEGMTSTFDKKKLLKEHPEINEADYLKTSDRKAYIKITLK